MTALIEGEWAAARAVASGLAARLADEPVTVGDSAGRTLAADCLAACDLPNFDTSAMDGWAVNGPAPWRIVGDVAAGRPWNRELPRGEAVRVATGSVMPSGATGVLRWESAVVDGDLVRGDVSPGVDVRPAGEECRVGDVIARAGTDVTPALAGFLAATGHDEIRVTRRPRVHLILLGDELQVAGIPSDGRVRDSLGPQLPGWLDRMGAVVAARAHVPDRLEGVVAAFEFGSATADLIVTTGGTAAGPRDHVHAAIEQAGGRLVVDRVAVRPGHPMLLASMPGPAGVDVPLVGLPGNPHSAVVGLVTLAAPIVDAMLGRSTSAPRWVPTKEALRSPPHHTRLVAGNLVDGAFELSPYGGSAMLRGLAQSSGFAVVAEGVTPAGAIVQWLPLP
ncbi:MAG: molybdopterin molybdotransferase MoeA [Actinomycetota bacterium]|nr:molybdopterin molybdotransferase MoeA [Actinomycetota bacterium]